jgi:hypothetical protein
MMIQDLIAMLKITGQNIPDTKAIMIRKKSEVVTIQDIFRLKIIRSTTNGNKNKIGETAEIGDGGIIIMIIIIREINSWYREKNYYTRLL